MKFHQIGRRGFSDDVARRETGMSKQRAPSNSYFVAFVTFCSISTPNQTTWQQIVVVDRTQIEPTHDESLRFQSGLKRDQHWP